jgi:hypothetical protein
MIGRWPFRKTDAGASSSKAKAKVPPPKKESNRPYMSVEIMQALYDQNSSVGMRGVHLPVAGTSSQEGAGPSGASPRAAAAR